MKNSYECGMCLVGGDAKLIRKSLLNITRFSHILIMNNELYLKVSSTKCIKLLLKKKEINQIIGSFKNKRLKVDKIYENKSHLFKLLIYTEEIDKFDKRRKINEKEYRRENKNEYSL